jgi:hypothetical protein
VAAQLFADGNCDVEVVAELGGAPRPRHQTAVAGRHVTGEEVEPYQADTGVSDRADEGIDLRVRRHGRAPRPPKLNRREPGRPGGRRALQDRQLGEQDRAVDVESGHGSTFRLVRLPCGHPPTGYGNRSAAPRSTPPRIISLAIGPFNPPSA